jgi:hypothetical protein
MARIYARVSRMPRVQRSSCMLLLSLVLGSLRRKPLQTSDRFMRLAAARTHIRSAWAPVHTRSAESRPVARWFARQGPLVEPCHLHSSVHLQSLNAVYDG